MLHLQIVLTVFLLLWLLYVPSGTWWIFSWQVLAVGASLVGIATSVPWMFPPWWFPYAFMTAFLFIVLIKILRRFRLTTSPAQMHWYDAVPLLVFTVLGAYGSFLTMQFVMGHSPPVGVSVVNIARPFAAGDYLVAHGGNNLATNAHTVMLDQTVERFKRWRGQSYALDLIRIDRFGLRANGIQPADPQSYLTFSTPILSPCTGSVAMAVDGLPDMQVPMVDRTNLAGNYVIVDCKGFFVVLAHFRNGSIVAKAGQTVTVGEQLGEMGNSGNSTEPHLHIHAQRDMPKDFPLSGEPLVLTIDGRYLVRNDRISAQAVGVQ